MTDIFRKQLQRVRKKLDDPSVEIDEEWIEQLIGSEAVRDIKTDVERRFDAEVERCGIVLQPIPKADLNLSAAGLDYWNEVQSMSRKEPRRRAYEPSWAAKKLRKVKVKLPKQITFVGGLIAFQPKLNARERFIASLQDLVRRYEELPVSEKAKFTTDLAPEMGSLRFPQPLMLAQQRRAMEVRSKALARIGAIRRQATLDAWRAGMDKALGRGTGGYKISGRVGWEMEGSDEQSN